ncbi:hypothetical protein QQ020_02120 [Fulvivirgaceae bacterium BMA12]|uniref:Fibronectin type-III domain-containing protein n=1 Tax=Agaribacillus aureus TaxID=3051825 RepID=A0ABT8KZB1_9BACT|nr:hypothetical protein [Fulvivirgaceae bacterium BMA12]
MKTNLLLYLLIVFSCCLFSCKEDDEPQINRAPGNVAITISLTGNTALIAWTAAADPDLDPITYDIILNGNMIGQGITELNYSVEDLPFDFQFSGQVIARDDEGLSSESDFSFSTGPMTLLSYTVDGSDYELTFNDEGQIAIIESPSLSGIVTSDITFNAEGKLTQYGDLLYQFNTAGQIGQIDNGDLTAILLYDGEGNMTRLNYAFSTGFSDVTVDKTLTYDSQNKLDQLDVHYLVSGTSEYYRYQFSFIGENVSQINLLTSIDGINYASEFLIAYSYDEMKNPWYGILTHHLGLDPVYVEINNRLSPTMDLHLFNNFPIAWMSRNNVTKATLRAPDLSVMFEESFSYNYNEYDYPVTQEKVASIPGGSLTVTRTDFNY